VANRDLGDVAERVVDLAQFRQAYEERVASKKRLTLLLVKRGALARFVMVKQGEESEPVVEGESVNAE